MPDFSLEAMQAAPVAGVDEAGRGPWAGPVVAAAVILSPETLGRLPEGIDDSKALSSRRRVALFEQIQEQAVCAVGMADVAEIDRLNILEATKLAMRRAVEGLSVTPGFVLVDGNQPPVFSCPCKAIVKGDSVSLSIAAASIIAKVTRDRIMEELALRYPGYGWERNAGYGTKAHREGIAQHGITPHHRRSFAPIRKWLHGAGEEAAA